MAKYINRRKTNTFAALLSLAVIIVYVLNLDFDRQKKPGQLFDKPDGADRFADNVEIKQFDQTGNLTFNLTATSIEYYDKGKFGSLNVHGYKRNALGLKNGSSPEFESEISFDTSPTGQDNTTYAKLSDPRLKVFTTTHYAELYADTALLYANHQIQLLSNVSIYESTYQSLLTTESLAMDIQLRQFLTQDQVIYSNNFSFSKAKGMEGNIIEGRWRLLSNVHSEIMPR